MINLPTTKQLRYFVALERHQHFGRAAEACFVSQPAFSVAIRKMESVLDVQLVDRTNKSVTITNIGKDIASHARLVLRDLESLVDIAQEQQLPLGGQLKLGVIPTIAPFLLPKVLPKLRKAYPKLKLYLQEDFTQRIYDRLMVGELDLILIALPYELRSTETMSLFKDPFYFACRQGTNLVDPEHYTTQQLPAESILLLEDGHCLRDHALVACKIRNTAKLSPVKASSLLTLIQMVDADLGVTYIPAMARDSSLLKNTRVKTYPLPASSHREIGLVWRKGSVRGKEFRMLGELIQSVH